MLCGIVFRHVIGYRLQKVGFAQARFAVNEEGVEIIAGVFRHGFCGGIHEFVAAAYHEGIERIIFIERHRAEGIGKVLLSFERVRHRIFHVHAEAV